MQILEIKVSELVDFVEGNLWKSLTPKPISDLRAISQSQNPRAKSDDVALLIAFENETLVGLVGLLPDYIHGDSGQLAYSNSCWWANPDKGKHLAVPLFLKAFSLCNQRMFMTDCTPHTITILEKTKLFDFPEVEPGIRGFLKFNLHELIPAKIPSTRILKPILKLADKILNSLNFPFRKITSAKFLKHGLKIELVNSFSPELVSFIETNSKNEYTRRSAADLEWITRLPWIKKSGTATPQTINYPFSYSVKSFEQYWLKVSEQGKVIGLLFISVRDSHMKIPYAYFDQEDAVQLLKVIYGQAILKNVVTLTIFNSKLTGMMEKVSHPFLLKKQIRRLVAISKQLTGSFQYLPEFQDGDGDVVFT